VEAYHLYATGDPQWVVVRDRGGDRPLEGQDLEDSVAAFEAGLVANPRIEVTSCVSRGFGDWGVFDEGVTGPDGHYFRCNAVEGNDFFAALGLEVPAIYEWVVAEGEVVAVRSQEQTALRHLHMTAFLDWLEGAHPSPGPSSMSAAPRWLSNTSASSWPRSTSTPSRAAPRPSRREGEGGNPPPPARRGPESTSGLTGTLR
jgi:hypothetical protein